MKKILVVFLLSAKFVNAFNSGLNTELSYLYVTFIAVVLLIIGIDKGIKLVRKKLKEKEEIFNEHKPANPIE
jgi:predicted RND superfamily exporter protein